MVVVAKPGDNSFNPSRYRFFDSAPCKFSSRMPSCPSRMTHLRHRTAHQGWRSLPFQRRRQSLGKNVASFFQTADDSFDRSWIDFTISLKAHWSQETPFALQNWHSFASKIPFTNRETLIQINRSIDRRVNRCPLFPATLEQSHLLWLDSRRVYDLMELLTCLGTCILVLSPRSLRDPHPRIPLSPRLNYRILVAFRRIYRRRKMARKQLDKVSKFKSPSNTWSRTFQGARANFPSPFDSQRSAKIHSAFLRFYFFLKKFLAS